MTSRGKRYRRPGALKMRSKVLALVATKSAIAAATLAMLVGIAFIVNDAG